MRRRGNLYTRGKKTDSHASLHPKGTCFAARTGSE